MGTKHVDVMQTCAMCGGQFPGPGVTAGDKLYCCNKCADYHQHKLHLVAAIASKLIGILSLGAIIGYLIGRSRSPLD